jgi:hypothetical protein
MDIRKEELLNSWNNIFNTKILLNDIDNNSINILFNNYLSLCPKYNHSLRNDIILCLQDKTNNINIYYIRNNILIQESISKTSKKKFLILLSQYKIIIYNFALGNDIINNQIQYRYEIIKNYFCGYNCNYYNKHHLYSNNEYIGLFTNILHINIKKHIIISFASMLLNYFELGQLFGDILFRPKITISDYGRWYISGSYKIQNSIEDREKFIQLLKEEGNTIVSLDLKAAEGNEFYNLNKSPTVKMLLNDRNISGQKSEMSKFLLNIIIHSDKNINTIEYLMKNKFSSNLVDYCYPNFYNIVNNILKEVGEYDNNIIIKYRKKLYIKENIRRIINPLTSINTYDNINIKEHRKYLQGHVIDKLLLFSLYIFKKLDILPITFIHDEILYICNDSYILDIMYNIITKYKIKMNIKIC